MADAKQTTPPPPPVPPPAPEPTELEAALRDRLGLAPDADPDAVLSALDEVLDQASAPAVTELVTAGAPALEKRTIRHGLFTHDLPGGGQAVAKRGDTVELLPHDIERGDRFDAFTARVGQMPEPPAASTLVPFAEDASDAEVDAWLQSGSVPEIVAAVNSRPEILTAVIAAEQRRKGDARKTLLDALSKMGGD